MKYNDAVKLYTPGQELVESEVETEVPEPLPRVDHDVLVELECRHCGDPLNLFVCKLSRAIEVYGPRSLSDELLNYSDQECRNLGIDPDKYRGLVYSGFRCCGKCREYYLTNHDPIISR